jgi:hypothetical protein
LARHGKKAQGVCIPEYGHLSREELLEEVSIVQLDF